MNRRNILKGIAAGAAGMAAGIPTLQSVAAADDAIGDYKIEHKKIRHSVMGWCFMPMPVPELIDHCAAIGIEGIEGIGREHYPLAIEKGLKISLVDSHGFKKGPTDKQNHPMVEEKILEAIDLAKKIGSPNVIVFSGYVVPGLSREEMTANCIAVWKKVIGHAEKQGITICFEHLSSRDSSHPMKGHPGYFADDVDQCLDMVKQIDSDHFKLLFDIYHVSVMNGDIIRRLRDHKELIGHIHTAGNPGRGELDLPQEIQYPDVMNALFETGFKGFVAHEFIPTREDKILSLRKACKLCDIA